MMFKIEIDLITKSALCGVMSVFSSLQYCVGDSDDPRNLYWALSFVPLGLFFDIMDGKVARWRNSASLMGQELDSLADMVCAPSLLTSFQSQLSFGVSPAVIAVAIGICTPIDHLFLSFFVLCGLTRLARFNVTVPMLPKDESGKCKYFEGTPITLSLGMISVMAYWVSMGWTHRNIPMGIWAKDTVFEVHPVVAMFVLHGCSMLSKTIQVPKP
jgi:CDP-diacylglycerol--serine O-phosphatidyltransferase